MPGWHFSWLDGVRCKWWKKEFKTLWGENECLDDTYPKEIEENVSDSKNYNSENNDKKKKSMPR